MSKTASFPKPGTLSAAALYAIYTSSKPLTKTEICNLVTGPFTSQISSSLKRKLYNAIAGAITRQVEFGNLLVAYNGQLETIAWNKEVPFPYSSSAVNDLLADEYIQQAISKENELSNLPATPVIDCHMGQLRRSLSTGRIAYIFWLLSLPSTDPEKLVGSLSYRELKHILGAYGLLSSNNGIYVNMRRLVDLGYLVSNGLTGTSVRFSWSGAYSYPHPNKAKDDQWITASTLMSIILNYRNGGVEQHEEEKQAEEQPDVPAVKDWTEGVLGEWGKQDKGKMAEPANIADPVFKAIAEVPVPAKVKHTSFATAQSLDELIEIRDVLKEILSLKQQISEL